MRKRTLYTTSEYLDALELQSDGNLYECLGKDFAFFSNAKAAEYDAEWLVKYSEREGLKRRKPTVYRIRLEKVKE